MTLQLSEEILEAKRQWRYRGEPRIAYPRCWIISIQPDKVGEMHWLILGLSNEVLGISRVRDGPGMRKVDLLPPGMKLSAKFFDPGLASLDLSHLAADTLLVRSTVSSFRKSMKSFRLQ